MLLLSALLSAQAQTINAASCNATDVQTAFNSVTASTTTVNIPAGTCNWSTQVTLTVPSGNSTLSILGAGNLNILGGGDQTVIEDGYASNNSILVITTAGSSSYLRLAGITFEGGSGGSGNPKYNGIVQILGLSQSVRSDHNHFNTTTYSSATSSSLEQFNGCIYGVVDHSLFDNPPGSVNNSVRAYNQGSCYNDSLGLGDQSWAHSTALGSANFLFAEDNTFNNGAGNDCTQGGRYVWRYNTMNMTTPAPTVQTHPTGGGGRERGCRAWEIYNNQLNAASGNYICCGFWVSSGTGVFWNNTAPSSPAGGGTGYGNLISGHEMRANNNTYPETAPPNGWGYCGTAQTGSASNWDENNDSTGYACLDQIGRGIGDLLVNNFPTVCDSNSSDCTSNIYTGRWPSQALEPIYEWLDAWSPVPNNPSHVWNESDSQVTINRDYYLGTNDSGNQISFNGTSGVGSGVLSARPATCTLNVAYWATDTTTLYQCSAPNTWAVYYTPYTYPHPLTQGQGQPPAPPSGLQALVD